MVIVMLEELRTGSPFETPKHLRVECIETRISCYF
jgi:hypothetical protein